jgi:hypothetical protein
MKEMDSKEMVRLIAKTLDANRKRFASARHTGKIGRSAAMGRFASAEPAPRSKSARKSGPMRSGR